MCFMDAPPAMAGTAGTFADRMMAMLNNAGLSLMVSVGHRTGLFDTMAEMPPATAAETAERAGLQERYVREWLGAMVTGRIVMYDAASQRFHLPPDHAAMLTRRATPNNMAAVTQFIAVLAGVEDQIVDCFHEGGGVPYAAFPRFQETMVEESNQTVVSALMEHIMPMMPEMMERMEQGCDVLDVGCGRGRALLALARQFPRSRFTGYDIDGPAIANANATAAEMGLKNVRFAVCDVARMNDENRYDLVLAFDAIHDQAHPDRVLAAVRRALRPDGRFMMQDIAGSGDLAQDMAHPMAPFLYTISCMHCMTVSLAEGGRGLGAMWGRKLALQMLDEAGFAEVDVRELPHDIQNHYYVARLSAAA